MLKKYVQFMVKSYLFTLLSIAFVITYWASAYKLQIESLRYSIVVSAVAVLFIVWNLVLSVSQFRTLYRHKAEDEAGEKKKWDWHLGLNKKKLLVIGITVLYTILIPVVGYCVSTFCYLLGLSFFLGARKPLTLVGYSLVFVAALYLIFQTWLSINLPTGFLI